MTLEEFQSGSNTYARLTECPFCGACLRKSAPPHHIRECSAAKAALGTGTDE